MPLYSGYQQIAEIQIKPRFLAGIYRQHEKTESNFLRQAQIKIDFFTTQTSKWRKLLPHFSNNCDDKNYVQKELIVEMRRLLRSKITVINIT